MKGTTNAPGDFVTTGTAQNISGVKTHTNDLIIKNVAMGLKSMNTSLPDTRTNYIASGSLDWNIGAYVNGNGNQFAQVNIYDTPTQRNMRLRVISPTKQNWMSMGLMDDNGAVYSYATSRATPTENDEILTLRNGVTLGTAQTIGGIKTFTNYGSGLVRQTITVRAPTDAEITAGTVWFQIYTHINTSTACKMRIRAYSRHDSFEFVIGLGGSGSGSVVSSGGFTHRTNSSRRVVFANDGTNVKLYVNGINSAGGYTLTIEQLASDGYAGTSDTNSFPLTYNDTPIAYPTTAGGFSNIVELTDLTVNTGYSQTIGGIKTFTSTMYKSINKSTSQLLDTTTWTWLNGTEWRTTDSPKVRVADIRRTVSKGVINGSTTTDQQVYHMLDFNLLNTGGTEKGISVILAEDGTSYATTTAKRTYASAGNNDILTKEHLESDITIDGIKTFTRGTSSGLAIIKRVGGDASSVTTNATLSFQTNAGQRGDINNWETGTFVSTQMSAIGNSRQFIAVYTNKSDNTAWATAPFRPYANMDSTSGASDILTRAHVPDLISANVGNGQISLTSSRGTAIDNFTVNQSSGKNIVLPASSTQYTNQTLTFALQSTPDFSDYPYMASKSITGLTADMYASVTYDDAQVSSGQYAPFCQTLAGEVRLYAKSDVGEQTIPTISIGMDDSSAQQSMSNFVTLTGAQDISGTKTFYTTGFTRLAARSTRTSGNIGGVVFVDSYGTDKGSLIGTVGGGLYLSPKNDNPATISNQRAYSSSNTEDIVTIGSLQASTDVVHTVGNETIGGTKVIDSFPKASFHFRLTSTSKVEIARLSIVTDTTIYMLIHSRSNGSVYGHVTFTLDENNAIRTFTKSFIGDNLGSQTGKLYLHIEDDAVILSIGNASSMNNYYSILLMGAYSGAGIDRFLNTQYLGRSTTSLVDPNISVVITA